MNHEASNLPEIWIADDDPDDQELIAEACREFKNSYQCRFFSNGQHLVDALPEQLDQLPNLIILDGQMPLMNGMQVLGFLMTKFPEAADRYILLVGVISQDDLQHAANLGVRVFTKPDSFAGLMAMTKELLGFVPQIS